jgi:NMD protein affecting ribosome stability and mRNA decay
LVYNKWVDEEEENMTVEFLELKYLHRHHNKLRR